MKKCSRCEFDFPETSEYFYRNKNKKNGLYSICKKCYKEKHIKYKDSVKKYKAQWRREHLKDLKRKKKEYYLDHKKEEITRVKKYVENNKDRVRKYRTEYYLKNAEKIKERNGLRGRKKRDEIRKYRRKYDETNAEKIKARNRKYNREHKMEKNRWSYNYRRVNLNFKITTNLRNRIVKAIRCHNTKKYFHTMELVGCSIARFKYHIEEQFVNGMSWDNYGRKKEQWSIDHIRPCASFDLTQKENQLKCFNYNNLRPLWNKIQWDKNSYYNGQYVRRSKKDN